jgi:hypothetical protein
MPHAGAPASPAAPRGDGRKTATPAIPPAAPANLPPASQLLSAKELGDRFGKSKFAVYRWINEGLIPERFLHYRGKREMLISVEVVEHLRAAFREMHE